MKGITVNGAQIQDSETLSSLIYKSAEPLKNSDFTPEGWADFILSISPINIETQIKDPKNDFFVARNQSVLWEYWPLAVNARLICFLLLMNIRAKDMVKCSRKLL